MRPFVKNQVPLLSEALLAHTTHKGLLASVEPLVNEEPVSASEGFGAELAGVRFLASVEPLVDNEAGLLGKGLLAHTAHKGPLARVRPLVYVELRTAREGFGAEAAKEGFLVFVLLHVGVKGASFPEDLLANTAGELWHTVLHWPGERHNDCPPKPALLTGCADASV